MDHAAIIGLTVPAVAGCMCAIFLSFWYNNRSDRSALYFAVAFSMCAIGFSLNHFVLAKESLANAIVHNSAYAFGLYLLVTGMHRAFRRPTPHRVLALLGVASVALAVLIELSPASLDQRILWINMVHGTMLLVGLASLWGIWKRNWTGTATYAATTLCVINFMIVSPINVVGRTITENGFFESVYWQSMNVLSTFSVLAMGGALIAVCVMQRLHDLRQDADHDFLTGLKNRRAFEAAARQYCETRSGDVAASLILIDLDHFKQINDDHGHAAGDEVISQFGRFLRTQTRNSDMAGRMGGEEFCLLLPGTDAQGARQLATRLRTRLSSHVFDGLPSSCSVTASFGIAELGCDTVFADVYPMADAALYAAKTRGRNRAVCAPSPTDGGEPIRREVFRTRPDGSRVAASRLAS